MSTALAMADDDLSHPFHVAGQRLDDMHKRKLLASRSLRLHLFAKRSFDIGLSSALLLLFSPLIVFCLILIKLTSDGPAVFSQDRWGLDQSCFRCLKIRTMYVAGDPRQESASHSSASGDGTILKMAHDPRVTPAGRWMRRTSIDELPQLWNVLRGDMSIVGPRPLLLAMLDPFDSVRAARCAVRPGITGLWQIRNRVNNTHVKHMVAHDAEYIRNFSFWLDLRILLATPKEVLRGAGAH